ncbi:DUF6119 family protein [Vannielia sp.]|uniref:DUF6119 family protein n=1 Tax=Vannielia sp. TaxID=2813045 RepID=UPI002616A001|nr:DUF6119 family protein [Vannielia sp.]MDF1871979.1 TIGR04141 family sporadically distributed protein [Vannielia sp.]
MTGNTQKLSIRLLKDGLEPKDGARDGVDLEAWDKLEGALIVLDTMGGAAPKWSKFLELSDEQKKKVYNNTAFGLVFIPAAGRWFAVSFGMGHVKLDPTKFEQDFGLRIVLNSVDPNQLKSADVRTPDENTLSRRSQTSRGSDQTAFLIDVERDIVRGLAGTPKDKNFASRVAGTDSLSMDRKVTVADLPAVCTETLASYQKDDYKEHFSWIDQIKHVRENEIIENLNAAAVAVIDAALKGSEPEGLHLAFPVIYDPEKSNQLRYKGFRSSQIYPDLDLDGYLEALQERGKTDYGLDDFGSHTVHEVDDEGRDCGGKWKISECLVCEVEHDGRTYVLSGGRWYEVESDLAKQVQEFFEKLDRYELPDAKAEENEQKYNARLKVEEPDLLCLDAQLVKPTGSATTIEVCDFLSKDNRLIHIKDKTSSSRLSHLFSQGTVSGRVLILDGPCRDKTRVKVGAIQAQTGQTGFETIICADGEDFRPQDFTVVYAVIGTGETPKLPFFSMITLRQAARELKALGYSYEFAWIKKPAAVGVKKKKATKSDEDDEVIEEALDA